MSIRYIGRLTWGQRWANVEPDTFGCVCLVLHILQDFNDSIQRTTLIMNVFCRNKFLCPCEIRAKKSWMKNCMMQYQSDTLAGWRRANVGPSWRRPYKWPSLLHLHMFDLMRFMFQIVHVQLFFFIRFILVWFFFIFHFRITSPDTKLSTPWKSLQDLASRISLKTIIYRTNFVLRLHSL